jgi:DNA-binding NarL/FixJ family response regulator
MKAITGKPLRGTRVLIAEDNPILAFDIAGVLRDAGAETVGPAKNLRDALKLAGNAALDCGILDVSLCGDLVFPAAKLLTDRGLGIVFYTGYGDPESLSRDWPFAQILIKPAPPPLLVHAVALSAAPLAGAVLHRLKWQSKA